MAIANRHFLLANQLAIDGSIEDKSACSHLFQNKSKLGLGLKNQYECWELNLDPQQERCSLLTHLSGLQIKGSQFDFESQDHFRHA